MINGERRCERGMCVRRSKATTEKLCALLMNHSSNTVDLPPAEIPNPDTATYASDLISIQDMLLEGKVGVAAVLHRSAWTLSPSPKPITSGPWRCWQATWREKTCSAVCAWNTVPWCSSNTLAVILPLILSQGKAKLEGVSLENWPRLLSGVLATVSSANSIPILTEMGKNLAAQQHLIPAQVCFMVEIGAISDT